MFLGSWSRPSGRAAGIPRSPAGGPARPRGASSRRRRSSTTSCCPMPSGWTPSPICSWPRSKATWAGPCSSKSCGPGASSGPGNSPRKCVRACRVGGRAVRGEGRRLFVRTGPLDQTLPGLERWSSSRSPRIAARSLGNTEVRSLPLSCGTYSFLTSPVRPSQLLLPEGSSCCLPTCGVVGSRRAPDPQGDRSGPSRALLEPGPVGEVGGEDSSMGE